MYPDSYIDEEVCEMGHDHFENKVNYEEDFDFVQEDEALNVVTLVFCGTMLLLLVLLPMSVLV